MSEFKNALEQVASRVSPRPGGLDRIARRLKRRKTWHQVRVAVFALLIAIAGAASVYLAFFRSAPPTRLRPLSGRCEDLIPNCKMPRLDNLILTGQDHFGALGPVAQVPTDAIGFDVALIRAWAEDAQPSAKSVQVLLGSADPAALQWDSNSKYFYAVKWQGVCVYSAGGRAVGPQSPHCSFQDWVTIIDASTGAFIVGGTG